jgi:hypothetical protein
MSQSVHHVLRFKRARAHGGYPAYDGRSRAPPLHVHDFLSGGWSHESDHRYVNTFIWRHSKTENLQMELIRRMFR